MNLSGQFWDAQSAKLEECAATYNPAAGMFKCNLEGEFWADAQSTKLEAHVPPNHPTTGVN